MKLAINYSLQAAELLTGGKIEVDLFKCPDWPNLIAAARPYRRVAVHFGLKAGSGRLKDTDWEAVAGWLEQTGTPYVNLHLHPDLKDYPGFAIDTLGGDQFEQVVKNLLDDVRAATKRFGAERVIVENVPYRGESGNCLRPAVEPQVIHRILDECGCGLLLDISHARIAAHFLGWDERQYMSQLPVDRLRELHFTGLHRLDGRLQDHLPALEEDWMVLDWVIECIQSQEWALPWMLAFEYGGVGKVFEWRSDPQVIAEQIPRLYQVVKDV